MSLPIRRLRPLAFLALSSILLPTTAVRASELISEIDFTNDIVPIFTKLGCNGGGCHGKSTGRGGFKLSLFGYEPQLDYQEIVHGSRGRRLFQGNSKRSLLLLKPIMAVPHGGGLRMKTSAPEYQLLLRWISNETPWGKDDAPRIESLHVEPSQIELARGSKSNLKVTAVYSNGKHRDVTRLTKFKSNDPSIVLIDEHGKLASQNRTGQAAVVAQYQGQAVVCQVLSPAEKTSEVDQRLAEFQRANKIDEFVIEKLKRLRIPPSEPSDDATFLRRTTVKISGRIPTREEVKIYSADDSKDKRQRLINRLLDSPGYADHFAQKWCDVLRIKRRGQNDRTYGTTAFHRWMRNSIASNRPYDDIVRDIITATGNVAANPPAQWYAEVRYLDRYVDDTAQVFLGLRIGCARCHHHPFESYSQNDYYGLAAFFGRGDRKGGSGVAERRSNEAVFIKASGSVKNPATGLVVLPHGLGSQGLEIPEYADPRQNLVDWMTASDNPYFAKAFVNRMWAHFFGRGIVDPMDDLRVTNPASNQELLDWLAEQFIENRFDMKSTIRLICSSNTYQLSANADQWNEMDYVGHARFYPQRLSAEVLLDAIDQATEVSTRYSGLPTGTRAVQLPDEGYSNEFLRIFGRPPRESACECERSPSPSLSQSLFVMNNSFVTSKMTGNNGLAARLAKDKRPHSERVTEMFLTVLSRNPEKWETDEAIKYLGEEADAKKAYGNLLWALMNTKEFYYVR
ncbi:MAG: S-layer protein [Planctomycetaceae bacterium]|nr:S-layer protein [Planctomycetaceae bacterium]